MRRRAFITLLGGAAAWPLAAQAQQSTMPVVGFLRSTPADPFTKLVDALRLGLSESGLVEGANVTIDYRYADNHLERLPSLAAELAHRPVNVIVANSLAAEAARGHHEHDSDRFCNGRRSDYAWPRGQSESTGWQPDRSDIFRRQFARRLNSIRPSTVLFVEGWGATGASADRRSAFGGKAENICSS